MLFGEVRRRHPTFLVVVDEAACPALSSAWRKGHCSGPGAYTLLHPVMWSQLCPRDIAFPLLGQGDSHLTRKKSPQNGLHLTEGGAGSPWAGMPGEPGGCVECGCLWKKQEGCPLERPQTSWNEQEAEAGQGPGSVHTHVGLQLGRHSSGRLCRWPLPSALIQGGTGNQVWPPCAQREVRSEC